MRSDFGIVADNLPLLLEGFKWTVLMCVGAVGIGAVLGAIGCAGKLIGRGPLFWISASYVEIFRTIPEIVIIFWIYYCAPLAFDLRLSPAAAGLAALSLYAGAILTEIFRAGVQALPQGQMEAARSLGIPKPWVWLEIVIPQALQKMMAPMITFLTDLIKLSGLLSTISISELVYQASVLSGQTFRHFEFFTTVGIFYFLMIFPLSVLAQRFERLQLVR